MAEIILGENKQFLGDIFGWWYSKGIRDFFIYLKAILAKITDIFSVKLLLRTYLSPWKRDITSTEGLPLNEVLRVFIFNLVSRFIGFIIKTIILFIYLIVLAVFLAIALSLVIIWLFLPLISIISLIYGIQLLF
ncbi:MAG: hypothetical protein CEN92_286 [Candidatus Berkelbacteria bacterium Licking1014_96]|uniref:Uncharacterized protein n=1 Tax=Candidatus Berkelbacteria bacterium Licking1014_96 TaxID=2017149 RepID=A0A554LFM6_9BACT|nr:MAG: hypothetical protein CEN92_286 [Candidatus Berkelbacteria bacterium Licking1014_96]